MTKWIKKKIKQFRCKHENVERYSVGSGYFLTDNNQRRCTKCTDCEKVIDRFWVDELGYRTGGKW